MYSDLMGYSPERVDFVVNEHVKEIFPGELDFSKVEGAKVKGVLDAIKFVGDEFVATFPSGETAMRKLDEYEIRNIREEYCVMQENEVPKRKQELEETLEEIKAMKKRAEQAYDSILAEVSKYAAEVKVGTREVMLDANETFCIAIAGYYVFYTYDKKRKIFVLAKAFKIEDTSEFWASEDKNRESMKKYFGLDFPETSKPKEEKVEANEDSDNLPFGDEGVWKDVNDSEEE